MAANKREKKCDFKLKGTFSEDSCKIYKGNSSTIVAQMEKKDTVKTVILGRDTFEIKIDKNVDHAFIISLIIILYEIENPIEVKSP
ncbi:Protein LURP1 [Acorus calamus]|uniref:Protein LURP1 n=1 Tax=Acorus calamus TaxID=4465 RepID=A0AAV9CDB4_ACOCL|nr:Protein LURP1 [Acorus calamus]